MRLFLERKTDTVFGVPYLHPLPSRTCGHGATAAHSGTCRRGVDSPEQRVRSPRGVRGPGLVPGELQDDGAHGHTSQAWGLHREGFPVTRESRPDYIKVRRCALKTRV